MRDPEGEYGEVTAVPVSVSDQPPKVYPDLLNPVPSGKVIAEPEKVAAVGTVPTAPFVL